MQVRSSVLALALVLLTTSPCWANEGREALEARIRAELRVLHPGAESLFVAARQAEGLGEFAASARLYHQAGELVPGNPHLLRREGVSLVVLGERDRRLELLRRAVGTGRTPENLGALAYGLIRTPGNLPPSTQELREAAQHVEEAIRMEPEDIDQYPILGQIALMMGDPGRLRNAVKALRTGAPDSLTTHYFAAFAEAVEGRKKAARIELDEARRRGLPEDEYVRVSGVIARIQPPPAVRQRQALVLSGWTLGVWLGALAMLLLVGLGLSATTMRAARRVPNHPHGRAAGLDAFLRRLYMAVLWASCAYYYVSLPLLVLLVLGTAGAMLYGFYALGHIPIKLAAIVALLALVTVWAIVRSLFTRVADADPGLKLDLARHPRLREVLDRVAARIGTRPVDHVFMTPGTDIAVLERGGMLRQLRGASERCLILGAGVLEGMRLGPFRAVLGHDTGTSPTATPPGGFALAVRRSLVTMAVGIARGGAAGWYNPAWLFLNGFYRVFLRISQGASRLQEILADRWAAFGYGAAAFERGLRHVIHVSAGFDARIDATLKEVIERKLPLANLYAYQPSSGASEAEIDKAFEAALVAEPSPYDSHPSPADRFASVRALSTPDAEAAADDEDDVWSLFTGRAELERQMTEKSARPSSSSMASRSPPWPDPGPMSGLAGSMPRLRAP